MKTFLVILAIATLSQGAEIPKDQLTQFLGQAIDLETLNEAKADASTYFDQVLANLREQMLLAGMNAMPLPDQVIEFEQNIGGINWRGTAALFNGTLMHMDTLHRTGTADLSVEPNGEIIISAEVGVNRGTLHYEMIATFMDLGPHAIVDGTLSRVRVLMSLRIDLSSRIVHLQTFDIKSTGVLSVDIKGLGAILNFLVEIVSGFLGNLIKGIVVMFVEGPIKNIVNSIISNILFPPDSLVAIQFVQAIVLAAMGGVA